VSTSILGIEDALPFLRSFTEPGVDRYLFLLAYLNDRGFSPHSVELDGCRHIVLRPDAGGGTNIDRVLLAHHDRAAGSPGANDNAAAVFQLMNAAAELRKEAADSWLIVFTDKEEAAAGSGGRGQGSFGLAEGFKSIGLAGADFYIFDACGRGDTVIVSTTVDELLAAHADLGSAAAEAARRRARELRLRALEAGRAAAGGKVLLSPTPFSDDAGFLAAGIPAQTITLLPEAEAASVVRRLRAQPDRIRALIDQAARTSLGERAYRALLPETWKSLHGQADRVEALNLDAFPLMTRLAVRLART
jgi:Iap family predicted aminopeptidase